MATKTQLQNNFDIFLSYQFIHQCTQYAQANKQQQKSIHTRANMLKKKNCRFPLIFNLFVYSHLRRFI